MKKIALALILCAFFIPSVLAIDVTTTSKVDWDAGSLTVELKIDTSDLGTPTEVRDIATEIFQRNIGQAFANAMFAFVLDSHRTVKEVALNQPPVLDRLLAIAGKTPPARVHMDSELETMVAVYEFNLYPEIAEIFIDHAEPYKPPAMLGYTATTEYTGVVIYAAGGYPVHGEAAGPDDVSYLTPSLHPRIFDANMRLVAEAEMMDPDYLRFWGAVGYHSGNDFLLRRDRVGSRPLLTMAREVFGDNRTDLVVAVDAADKILSSEHNRRLIQQGRILIIYGP